MPLTLSSPVMFQYRRTTITLSLLICDAHNHFQRYPFLPLGGVLNYDFKLAFNLNLTHGFFSSAKLKGESRSKTIG